MGRYRGGRAVSNYWGLVSWGELPNKRRGGGGGGLPYVLAMLKGGGRKKLYPLSKGEGGVQQVSDRRV